MIQKLNPAWIFFPFTALFSILFLAKGQNPAMLSGAVFSSIAGFQLRTELAPGRAFPIFMLFLFLLVLGVAPVRGYSAVVIATTLLLITLRCLLLLLNEIQNHKAALDRSRISFSIGLVLQFCAQMILVTATFRGQPNALSGIAELLSLKVLFISAILFAPFGWIGAMGVMLTFLPILQSYSPWFMLVFSSGLMLLRLREKSRMRDPKNP